MLCELEEKESKMEQANMANEQVRETVMSSS